MLLLAWRSLNKIVDTILSIQSFREKFEVRIYIKREKKIKKIIIATTNNIIKKVHNIDVEATLLVRKNIIIVKKQFDIVIFRVKIKKSKRILKKTIFEQKRYYRTQVYAKSITT